MATAHFQIKPRQKLAARPKPEADAKVIRAEITDQYPKTLEYLGR